MEDPKQLLTATAIENAGLTDWRRGDEALTARFRSGNFATGLQLVARIGASAEAVNHHPDVLLTYPAVTVTLTSHDAGGVTIRDVRLARVISEHAAALGISAGAR
ncbi:4a-hydroxytetrahydrobiopterin dehydratase [Agrococcus sp. Ld7]|uniref:4a-hydroxytetrahydrobiopterin dehydratase n=1 Tax=Agrococcus sp. Ld7 TaxID=649148 RepID=UPI003866152C